MIEEQLRELIADAIGSAREAGDLDVPEAPDFDLMQPPRPEQGDWSTNAAMVLQKAAGKPPRDVAEVILRHLPPRDWILKTEVAGPGFVNLFLSDDWLHDVCRRVLDEGDRYGSSEEGAGTSVNVEFVSINPTGPLLVSHGRNAVLGDSIARLLEFTGHAVEREYYLNDAGNQMRLFLLSVAARYKELLDRDVALPEDGYQGGYIYELAREVIDQDGEGHADRSLEELAPVMRERVYPTVLRWIDDACSRLGVSFDVWFSEQEELHATGRVEEVVEHLRDEGHVYEEEGAIWLRTSDRGDSRDRPLVTSDGRFTYLAGDLAYHLRKSERGFDRLVDVWGADHHGQVPSLLAGLEMLGIPRERVEIVIYQWVHLVRAGETVPMSKRTGSGVGLDELLDEVGGDVARYTFLQSSADNTINFDIEEVTKQSLENPVYYVQYAHARIASLLRKAADDEVDTGAEPDWALLDHPSELDLMRGLAEFERVVSQAASERAPYRLAKYGEDLARRFHRFYTDCRVITADAPLTVARLGLARATKQVVANALGLLGVSAPEVMEWEEDG